MSSCTLLCISTARSTAGERRLLDRNRRVDEHHQAIARKARERRGIFGDDLAQCLVVFGEHPHDLLGRGSGREGGEPPQIAEHRHDLGTAALEHAVVTLAVDEFGHLGCQESLEFGNALLALLREGQSGSHGVEAVGQPLKLVASPDLDAVVELSGSDALGSLLSRRIGSVIRRARA